MGLMTMAAMVSHVLAEMSLKGPTDWHLQPVLFQVPSNEALVERSVTLP